METICLVTTSKGRLHHIEQTLPLMLALGADEVIVVDYGCPDGTSEWVEANHPEARVLRITDDSSFNASRARNLGAATSHCDWLVFIDADVKAAPGWVAWMRKNLQAGNFYRATRIGDARVPETFGTWICARSDFERIGGYDEVFRGWGGEDHDCYRRLDAIGVVENDYPGWMVTAIPHGDEERTGWGGMRSKAEQVTLTICYVDAKLEFARLTGQTGHLPIPLREKLMDYTQSKLKAWFEDGANKPLDIDYVLRRRDRWVPDPHQMATELRFTIRLAPQPAFVDLARR
jgi:glycosyltransferase involved in cell wall biosynthesis